MQRLRKLLRSSWAWKRLNERNHAHGESLLITGSSRGFGRRLAEVVLAHGDNVVATARTPAQLSDLVTAYGSCVHPMPLDVTNPEQARAAVSAAVEAFGRL